MRQRSPRRNATQKEYAREVAYYLAKHPFCQISIARHELDESAVVAAGGRYGKIQIPRATEVHHRNKRDGARLLDKRWWMAASRQAHDWVEDNKETARILGYLLPIQADEDGKWGDGNAGIETPAFMRSKARRP